MTRSPSASDEHAVYARPVYAQFLNDVPPEDGGGTERVRSESFADHDNQARLFWRSMSDPELRHIVSASSFELGKIGMVAIRPPMPGHLAIIEAELYKRVAEALGMEGQAERIQPARQPIDLKPSSALSLVQKAHCARSWVPNGSDRMLVDRLPMC